MIVADDYHFTNLVHIDGDDKHEVVQAFLIAQKAIGENDSLQYGSVDVFVFSSEEPPQIEKVDNEKGLTFKMTIPATMLSFEYDFHHNGEILHGKHNCSLPELCKFEKSYKRIRRFNRKESDVVQ